MDSELKNEVEATLDRLFKRQVIPMILDDVAMVVSAAMHADRIEAIRQEEREACAVIADQQGCGRDGCIECVGGNIATKIRALK